MALHRLTELGFSDAKVLALMRLYDETCLALCEGQFIDIWTSEGHGRQSVELYFDMIGRKTAALIAGSVQAGAMLATDDAAVIEAYRAFGWALGIAFQLNDDLLGIWGEETATGKAPVRPGRAQAHPADPLRARAWRTGGPRAPGRAAGARSAADARRSTRHAGSSSAQAPATTPATRRAGIATRPSASSR